MNLNISVTSYPDKVSVVFRIKKPRLIGFHFIPYLTSSWRVKSGALSNMLCLLNMVTPHILTSVNFTALRGALESSEGGETFDTLIGTGHPLPALRESAALLRYSLDAGWRTFPTLLEAP